MLGFIIGAIAGTVQFIILSKFTGSVSKGEVKKNTVLFAILQFLFPFIVLLGCAFFLYESLIWTGTGIVASLVICAAVRFGVSHKRQK